MEEARAQRAVERVKALRDGVKEQLTRLGERFDGDSGQLLADLAEARPAVQGPDGAGGPVPGGVSEGEGAPGGAGLL